MSPGPVARLALVALALLGPGGACGSKCEGGKPPEDAETQLNRDWYDVRYGTDLCNESESIIVGRVTSTVPFLFERPHLKLTMTEVSLRTDHVVYSDGQHRPEVRVHIAGGDRDGVTTTVSGVAMMHVGEDWLLALSYPSGGTDEIPRVLARRRLPAGMSPPGTQDDTPARAWESACRQNPHGIRVGDPSVKFDLPADLRVRRPWVDVSILWRRSG